MQAKNEQSLQPSENAWAAPDPVSAAYGQIEEFVKVSREASCKNRKLGCTIIHMLPDKVGELGSKPEVSKVMA